MPTPLIASIDAPCVPPRKRWTREECQVLQDNGLLEAGRYELIDGDLVSKTGKNRPHGVVHRLLIMLLARVFGEDRINFEMPIDVQASDNSMNEPEPDVIVLRCPEYQIMDRKPQPAEIARVVEVTDTTLAFDLRTKARLYARAGIADYWVIDVNQRRLIMHRNPADGAYQSVTVCNAGEEVRPLEKPEASLRVDDLFPPC